MVLEIASFKIRSDEAAAFEAAFREAALLIARVPGYLSHTLQRGIEAPDRYLFLVQWTDLDAHLVNFRQSPQAEEFRALLRPFFAEPPSIQHYTTVF